jgi:hypothetical protein
LSFVVLPAGDTPVLFRHEFGERAFFLKPICSARLKKKTNKLNALFANV